MKYLFRATWITGALLIVAVLVLLAMPTHERPNPDSAEEIAAKWIQETAKVALVTYRIHCGTFPSTAEGLEALIRAPAGQKQWRGPYLTPASIPLDPWGRTYHYRFPSEHPPASYDLWSDAADAHGDQDDITSW